MDDTPSNWSDEQIDRAVEVRRVEGKGRCLFTRRALAPGTVVYKEEPLLVALPSLDAQLWDKLVKVNEDKPLELPPIWHFAALYSLQYMSQRDLHKCFDKCIPDPDEIAEPSPDVLRVVERLQLCPLDASPTRKGSAASISSSSKLAGGARRKDDQLQAWVHLCETGEGRTKPWTCYGYELGSQTPIHPLHYQKMLIVWRYNSFGHHTEAEGLVLYNRTSLMAHSCAASCCWLYGDNDAYVLRSRVALKEGDELTISYIGDDDLIKSTDMRREKLLGWRFICRCDRCVMPRDEARGFRCPNCNIGTTTFQDVVDDSTDVETVTEATPCDTCGSVIAPNAIKSYTTVESLYNKRLDECDKNDLEDLHAVWTEAVKIFTQHWIIAHLAGLICEGLRDVYQFDEAIHFHSIKLNYLRKVMPLASYTLAWAHEESADLCGYKIEQESSEPDAPATQTPIPMFSKLVMERAYEDARALLLLLCGESHHYTQAAVRKLDHVHSLPVHPLPSPPASTPSEAAEPDNTTHTNASAPSPPLPAETNHHHQHHQQQQRQMTPLTYHTQSHGQPNGTTTGDAGGVCAPDVLGTRLAAAAQRQAW